MHNKNNRTDAEEAEANKIGGKLSQLAKERLCVATAALGRRALARSPPKGA